MWLAGQATLALIPGSRGWEISELSGFRNHPVTPHTAPERRRFDEDFGLTL